MSAKISRREFLKLTGIGAAATAVLTGCGPASRYVVRRPYTDMPEYQQTGKSTYYATTCRECAAGCGLVMRVFEGRAIKAEGNPNHPVNRGKLCSRGLTAVQGLYNPDRVKGPQQQSQRGSGSFQAVDWNAAVSIVADAMKNPGGLAFLFGEAPSHLLDLAGELASAAGAQAPVSYGAAGMLNENRTLVEAARLTFGKAAYPFFDLSNADLVFSFGADFLANWVSPVSYARAYGKFRKGREGRRGYLVSFDPFQTLTAGSADEWYPVTPGSEGLLALALGKLVLQARGEAVPGGLEPVDPAAAAKAAGLEQAVLEKLARRFAEAGKALAIPGGAALAHRNGLATAQAVLALNGLVGNLGGPGSMSLQQAESTPGSLQDVAALIERMNAGQIQALLIHGANPVFELPAALGFAQALQKVPLVISFASFPDETAAQSDYVLPDHTGLESFGYQRGLPGSDRTIVSSVQPVVVPLYDTKATADVLLAAAKAAGLNATYTDEVDFIQQKLLPLMNAGGSFNAPEIFTFWTQFLQSGGWWTAESDLQAPSADGLLGQPLQMPQAAGSGEELYFITYLSLFGDGSGANRPWLQETPDPLTTVMWNSYVLIHPETAHELGVRSDDIVKITSGSGEIEAVVYEYPAIRPDTIAMPFGQGHTALGRWAAGRGSNPALLLDTAQNEAGDLAYAATRVKVTATGQRRPLSRLESKAGVYGEH